MRMGLAGIASILAVVSVVAAASYKVSLENERVRKASEPTIWDGVYTAAQSTRGRAAYVENCRTCHKDDLSGMQGRLISERFRESWREDNLNSLFTRMKQTMPPASPGNLNNAEYVDILAYLLSVNGFPAGDGELERQDLLSIRFAGKDGPQPLPDRSGVVVVGCLAESPGLSWILTNAGDLIRKRGALRLRSYEANAFGKLALGTSSFDLDFERVLYFNPTFDFNAHAGRKVVIHGTLQSEPTHIFVNSIDVVAGDCRTGL